MSCRTRRRRLKGENDFQSMTPVHGRSVTTSKKDSPTNSTTTSQLSTNPDRDTLAVEWWRNHQGDLNNSNDISVKRDRIDPVSKRIGDKIAQNETLVDIPPFNIVSPFTTTLENSQRDLKGRPSNITHKNSLEKPQDGMVLDPKLLPEDTTDNKQLGENPSLGIFQTKGRSDPNNERNRIEFFQPRVERVSRGMKHKWRLPSRKENSSTAHTTEGVLPTVYNCYGDEEGKGQGNTNLVSTHAKKDTIPTLYNCYGDGGDNRSNSIGAIKNRQTHSQPLPGPSFEQEENKQEVSLSEYNSWISKASPERTKNVSDKNPHTATRSPQKSIERMSNSCHPIKSSGVFGKKNHADLLDEMEISSNDFEDRVVRYNGWSLQDPMRYPFSILGAKGCEKSPRVFTPSMMETLRGFMPMKLMNHNFWLRFSLARDGASFSKLLASVRASTFTIIGVETDHGEVFGCFTGSPWRMGSTWYGSRDAFLWRLKENRYTSPKNAKKSNFERQMELYHCTENDDFIQYCTSETIAVGGGEWQHNSCPYSDSNEGIGLVIDGDLAGGETNSCATFANPKLARHATISSEFSISNLEVWSLTPFVNIEKALEKEIREFPARGVEICLEK